MPNLTSQLAVKLIDGVSGPARGAAKSIREIGRSAKAVDGTRVATSRLGAAASGVVARAAGIGAGLIGVGALAHGAKEAVANYAELERKMIRVGITADASTTDIARATDELRRMSMIPGMPAMDKLVEGVDALVSQGGSLPEAMSNIRAISMTAAASGASVEDISKTAGALGQNFDIAANRMQSAFDVLNAGGKAGQFELKDMARYLPSLAAQAKIFGLQGEAGLRQFVAMSQIIRKVSGTSEEAASAMSDFFGKATSQAISKNFSKMGVDIDAVMAKARKGGKDLVETYLDAVQAATKGDMNKLNALFQDKEIRRAVTGMMLARGQLRGLGNDLKNVDGSTLTDFGKVAEDTTAKIDRMKASWDGFMNRLGAKIAPKATDVLNVLTEALDPAGTQAGNVSPTARVVDTEKYAVDYTSQSAARGSDTRRRNQERASKSSMLAHDLAEARDPNPTGDGAWNSGRTRADASIRNQRAMAWMQGKLTPGQSIARENELQGQIQTTAGAYARWKTLPRTDDQKAKGEAEFTRQITTMVTEFMNLQRSRNNEAMVSPEMLGKIVEGVKSLATPELGAAGSAAMQSFGEGITSQSAAVEAAATGVMDRVKSIMSAPISPNIQLPQMTVPAHGRGGSPAILPSVPVGKQSSVAGRSTVAMNPTYHYHLNGQQDPAQFAAAVHERSVADARKALRGVQADVGSEFG